MTRIRALDQGSGTTFNHARARPFLRFFIAFLAIAGKLTPYEFGSLDAIYLGFD